MTARVHRIAVAASPLAPPLLTYDVVTGEWCLAAPYAYAGDGWALVVPRSFRFDLSSIPRPLWNVVAPFELSIVGPLLHDWIYRHGGVMPAGCCTPARTFTRAEADALFRDIMRREGVSAWRRALAYAAVRAFGRGAWQA